MLKVDWFEPYDGKKVTCPIPYATADKKYAGIYFIRDRKTKELLYIGSSKTNIRNTLYRHFQRWNDKRFWEEERGYRVSHTTYKKHTIDVKLLVTYDGTAAFRLEKYFILKLNPRDNRLKYNLLIMEKEANDIERTIENNAVTIQDDDDIPF